MGDLTQTPTLIANRFEVGPAIGRGAMGAVYRARDTLTGEPVAIKQLRAAVVSQQPELLERFRREGEALRQLNHPNIVKVLATVEEQQQHYIVMEYVGGGSLADRLQREPRLPIGQVIDLALELADALARAHHLNIIHRDFKPANILLATDGTPRLTDFGLARLMNATNVTVAGMILGTIHYLSPEACDYQPLDHRADLWAFGVVLFQMLTGQLPFDGDTTADVMRAIREQPAPEVLWYRKDAPPALADLVHHLLMKDRVARLAGARLLGAELEAIKRGRPLPQPQASDSPPTPDRSSTPANAPSSASSSRPTPPPELLLSTKLFMPPLRSAIVPRPRLTQVLNDSLTRSLTLICAPAGFGKTTLLSEWRAAGQTVPLGWVSLDEADSDPMRFWQYVIAALNRLHAGVGDTALAMMRSPQPPPLEATLTVLINELAAVSTDFLLVLDDYHTITAQAVHEALAFLLDHLPEPLHVIILSRADPPLPLSRLRARRQLLELRANDLRCTPDEAAAFLNQVMRLNLGEADVTALETRTEGWMAGLQLAALSMQGRDDAAAFIASFKGDDRYVLDYLVEEVLLRQPAAMQEFLLNTSLLDRMTAALGQAVTSRDDAQAVLEQLERGNLFIVPLDNARRWYRYHHLFADLLRHRLHQSHPDRVPELHRRAAQWFEQNQLMDEAITHLLAAKDFDRAAQLIGQMVRPVYFARSEPHTLLNWIGALPPEIAAAYPLVGIGRAWCLMTFGQLDQAVENCTAVAAILGDTPADRARRGEVEAVLGTISMLRGDIPQLAYHAERALQLLPHEDVLTLGIVQWERGQVYRFAGEPATAAQAFGEAAQFSHAAGNLFFELLSLSNRADRLCEQGRLREGIATHRQVQAIATQGGRKPLPIIGDSYSWTAFAEWERNNLDAALADATRGVELTIASGIPEIILTTLITQARVLHDLGQLDQAQAAFDQALERAQQYNVPRMSDVVQSAAAQEQLHRGEVAEAWRWAQRSPIHLNLAAPIDYAHDEEYLVYAEVCLTQGRAANDRSLLGQTADLLQRSITAAAEKGRYRQVLRAQVLLALAQTAFGRSAEAFVALEEALRLGEPEGFVRSFVMHGVAMRSLLADCRVRLEKQRTETRLLEYIDRLRAAFPEAEVTTPPTSSPKPTAWPLVEPLSDRELDVLRLIAADRSNQDIASELYLSINTVKTHIQHIYEKLNVSSRLSAVEEARRLKLL